MIGALVGKEISDKTRELRLREKETQTLCAWQRRVSIVTVTPMGMSCGWPTRHD